MPNSRIFQQQTRLSGGVSPSGVDIPGVSTPGELSPLAKSVWDGTMKFTDLTPTMRQQIGPELNKAGYTRAITAEAKQDVSFITSEMDKVLSDWLAIPDSQKGTIQGRFTRLTKGEERSKEIAKFDASSRIVGMALTRLFEKGRISDQDRIFYLSLMPNLNQNTEAAQAGAEELKRLLGEKIKNQTLELETGIVEPATTDIDYLDSLNL